MQKDIGYIEDEDSLAEDSKDDVFKEESNVEASFPFKNKKYTVPFEDVAEEWLNQGFGSLEDKDMKTGFEKAGNLSMNLNNENTGLVDVLQKFLAESEVTRDEIVQEDDKISNFAPMKDSMRRKHSQENLIDHNIGLVDVLQTFMAENEDTEEGIVKINEKCLNSNEKENIGGIKNPPECIVDHNTGLVGVLQTFLAENEAEDVISGDISRQPEQQEEEIDLQTFLENEETDSEGDESNSDESLNYDTEDSDLESEDHESDSESIKEFKQLENGHK